MRVLYLWLAVVVLVPAMFVTIINIVATTPVVHYSHETRECVEVVSPDRSHDCGNLPDRHQRVWVQ